MRKHAHLLFGLLLCGLLLTVISDVVKAQKKKRPDQPPASVNLSAKDTAHGRKYIIMGKFFGNSVVLRWAPKTAAAWQAGNAQGYRLYRFEFNAKDRQPLGNMTQLITGPLKPLTLDQWKQGFRQDDTAAAIAVELLYGKKFETSARPSGKVSWNEAYTQYADMDNRLGYALLNADLHPGVAGGMGWRWEDKTAAAGKIYYYVLIRSASGKVAADTATVLVSTRQVYKLPVMFPVVAMPWDRTVTIYWNRALSSRSFTGYNIERSDDGGRTFHRLNRTPYINTDGNRAKEEWIHYTDSIPRNYSPYIYRVQGATAFGEWSKPSTPVTAAGLDKTTPRSPHNVKAENLQGSQVRVTWETSPADKDLAGFIIGRATSANGPFFPLDTVLLPLTAKSYIDKHALAWDRNFYIVAAIDTAGNASRSMPAYAMIRDTTPPAAPVGLTGNIDSGGIVRLHWRWNKEMDIEGYNVYAANNPAHAFYILNSKHVTDSNFKDTITLKTLTRHIYYRICAFDKAGNPSAYSAILELTKPDIIRPMPPVFNHFLITDSSVALQWAPSASEDAARQIVWRKEKNTTTWVRLDSLGRNIVSYTDHKVGRLKEYDYCLTVIDSSGLSSERSFPLQARIYDDGRRKGITAIRLSQASGRDLRLSWSYDRADRQHLHFLVYKNYNDRGLSMYKNISGDKNEFIDKAFADGKYQYAIKVVTDDGGSSGLIPSEMLNYTHKPDNTK